MRGSLKRFVRTAPGVGKPAVQGRRIVVTRRPVGLDLDQCLRRMCLPTFTLGNTRQTLLGRMQTHPFTAPATMTSEPFRHVFLCAIAALALVACSKQEPATPAAPTAPAPAAAPAPAPAPAVAENTLGKGVFGNTCAMCHAAGVAGAPKPGDKADWGPRIAQGNDVLYKHALEGFTGAKGMMPPRGGGASLTDDEVKAAVDFMVAQSR
jgi:cytochrome c5